MYGMHRKCRCLWEKADTAKLQDELTGALIGLARAVDGAQTISKRTGQIIMEGLFTTVTNVSFDNAAIEKMIQKVRAEKERLVPDCSSCQSPAVRQTNTICGSCGMPMKISVL